mgnify:CR=1 FL=1
MNTGRIRSFFRNVRASVDRGASMVEYALLVVLIALIAFAAVAFAGNELSSTYSEIADSVQAANNK